MRPYPFPLVAVAAVLLTFASRATADSEPAPIAVTFEPSASDLPQSDIRVAVGKELGREVRAEPAPNVGQLRIARTSGGELVVRYLAPANELERTVTPPIDRSQIPLLVALVAQNLVSGEPVALMRDLERKRHVPSAPAQPKEPNDPRRSGVHVRLSLAGGYGLAKYTFEGPSAPAFPPTRNLRFVVSLAGPSTALDVAAGYMTESGFAFGLEGNVAVEGVLTTDGQLGGSGIDLAILLGLNGYVDYYPGQRGPLHLQAGLGIARAGFASHRNDGSSFDNIVDTHNVFGMSGYVGVGYDLRGAGGLGFFARTHAANLVEEQSSYTPMGVRLGASMSWF
jgi:hypothetical protein